MKCITNKDNLSEAHKAMVGSDYGVKSFERRISEQLENIRNNSGTDKHIDRWDERVYKEGYGSEGEEGYVEGYNYQAFAAAYNSNIDNINTEGENARSICTNLFNALQELRALVTNINNYETDAEVTAAIETLEKTGEELGDSEYGEISYYSSDGEVGSPGGGSPGTGGGDPSPSPGLEDSTGDWDNLKDEVDPAEFPGLGDDDGPGTDDQKDDDDPTKKTGLDDSDGTGPDDQKDDKDPTDKTGLDDSDGTGPDDQKTDDNDPANKTGLGEGDGEVSSTKDNEDQATGAQLVSTSGNMVGDLTDEGGGLNLEDVAAWGAAGATATMLGLTNLGKDENGNGTSYLENLATGLDDDRTLPDQGLDVFEHPDYTGTSSGQAQLANGKGWSSYEDAVAAGYGNDVMSENEFLTAKANGDPSLAGYDSYQDYLNDMYAQHVGNFGWSSYDDVLAAGLGGNVMSEGDFLTAKANGDLSLAGYDSYQDYLNDMYDKYMNNGVGAFNAQGLNELGMGDENQTSFGAGLGAFAGAGLAGAGAAAGFMAYEDANGGVFGDEGFVGPDGQYHSGKKTINDIFFGVVDETDEEEKKKQSLREKIALLTTTGTSLASLTTFGFANAGIIAPLWFTIAILLFAIALLYFNLVKDQKNKRREELEAYKKVSVRRGFFNQNNVQETTSSNQVDWVLFGMILLSTSAFILKTYDVISWLLFLILLILFILIIVAYVILKKKLGENNNGVPY